MIGELTENVIPRQLTVDGVVVGEGISKLPWILPEKACEGIDGGKNACLHRNSHQMLRSAPRLYPVYYNFTLTVKVIRDN